MMSGSFGPGSKKGKSSPEGVTAEMLLALPEEQISRLARHMQDVFSSLNFQETWFRVMASLIPKKNTSERSQRVPSHQLLDHISQTCGVHLVTETASHLLEDTADSFRTAQTGR